MNDTFSYNDYAIAVMDKGFVFVGTVIVEGDAVQIYNPRNIRRWGGPLGKLALEGPQPNTILEPTSHIDAHVRSLVFLMRTPAVKWEKQ